MLFNVERDLGDKIVGYLVPDTFSTAARVQICSNGEVILVFEPMEVRDALVHAGRHGTGLCGFTIDETLVPGLAQMDDIELYDDESGCMIYRRPKLGQIPKRVIRLETRLFPFWKFDSYFEPYFQYFAKGVDRYGRETVNQMLLLNEVHSSYFSGRINYKTYAHYIENGFECCAMLQEPRVEMAERLLILRNVRKFGVHYLGDRDASRLSPAMNFAENLPLDDQKALRWALLDMPPEVSTLLANPLTRQLTTNNPDDMPNNAAISSALDILSTFAIVGLNERIDDFRYSMAAWLGLDPEPIPVIPPFKAVLPLAECLVATRSLDVILEKDIELYQHIIRARESVESASPALPSGL